MSDYEEILDEINSNLSRIIRLMKAYLYHIGASPTEVEE